MGNHFAGFFEHLYLIGTPNEQDLLHIFENFETRKTICTLLTLNYWRKIFAKFEEKTLYPIGNPLVYLNVTICSTLIQLISST